MRFRYLAGLSLAIALAAPAAASAQTLGTSVSGGNNYNSRSWSLGYFFEVYSPFTVNYLAFYDSGNDGFTTSHDVGLYDASGSTLISSATLGAGTGATLLDGFRLVAVPSFTLGIGTYQVLGTTGPEYFIADVVLTNAFGITYLHEAFCPSATLVPNCGSAQNVNGYFGANFAGEASVIPEPASMVLLGTGLVGVFGVARRRRNKEV